MIILIFILRTNHGCSCGLGPETRDMLSSPAPLRRFAVPTFPHRSRTRTGRNCCTLYGLLQTRPVVKGSRRWLVRTPRLQQFRFTAVLDNASPPFPRPSSGLNFCTKYYRLQMKHD